MMKKIKKINKYKVTDLIFMVIIFLILKQNTHKKERSFEMSGFKEANKKIEKTVVDSYKKIENGAVEGYKKVENAFVSGYRKAEDIFVENFLAEDGETVEDAKKRLNSKM